MIRDLRNRVQGLQDRLSSVTPTRFYVSFGGVMFPEPGETPYDFDRHVAEYNASVAAGQMQVINVEIEDIGLGGDAP